MIFYYKNLKIDYDIIGSGPPILFLHGWGGDKNSLITLAQYLRNNRIYTISMPDQLKEAWTVKDYSALIADFLLFVDVKKPDVVCHSFGGRIVLEMPETFNKIVFIDSAGLKSKFSIKKKIKI